MKKKTSHLQFWLTTYVPPPQLSRVPNPRPLSPGVAGEGTGWSGALWGGAGHGGFEAENRALKRRQDEGRETLVYCTGQDEGGEGKTKTTDKETRWEKGEIKTL